MGCACSASVAPGPHDPLPSEPMEPEIARLYQEIDARSSHSQTGELMSEPMPCVKNLRISSKSFGAYLNHGIDGDVDVKIDGKVYEEVKPPKLTKKNRLRITTWMQRLRAPRKVDESAFSYRTTATGTSSQADNTAWPVNGDSPALADGKEPAAAGGDVTGGYETQSSSSSDRPAAPPPPDGRTSTQSRAPLDGDLSSESEKSGGDG